MTMERKIGEIFEYNGEWYQCLKSPDGNCTHCDMNFGWKCPIPIKECTGTYRIDKKNVIFKKLEKVRKPHSFGRKLMQPYKLYVSPVVPHELGYFVIYSVDNKTIEIEIKQTKEDMEEKNLKPFDIQKAREGKPVCTRDGRKARIICYDRQSDHGFPLVVLVENTGAEKDEDVRCYRLNGTTTEPSYNLMMLPEKKEGWVNVFNHGNNDPYVGNTILPTEKLAKEAASRMNGVRYIATVKIEWEE